MTKYMLAVLAALALVLGACGGGGNPAGPDPTPSGAPPPPIEIFPSRTVELAPWWITGVIVPGGIPGGARGAMPGRVRIRAVANRGEVQLYVWNSSTHSCIPGRPTCPGALFSDDVPGKQERVVEWDYDGAPGTFYFSLRCASDEECVGSFTRAEIQPR